MISDGMHLRNITEKQIFSFIKLIAAAVIFYTCLDYAVLPVGEDISEIIQKDYLELGMYNQQSITGNLVDQYIQQ